MKCCCADEGCETLHDNPHKICNQTSFNARCAESNSATNASDGVDWVVGTMVWTLFDYCACPLAWSAFAACDLARTALFAAEPCCASRTRVVLMSGRGRQTASRRSAGPRSPPPTASTTSAASPRPRPSGTASNGCSLSRTTPTRCVPFSPRSSFRQAPPLLRCWPLTAQLWLVDFPDARRGGGAHRRVVGVA